jgi:hypothetical protein
VKFNICGILCWLNVYENNDGLRSCMISRHDRSSKLRRFLGTP